jgi:hypothetical protein
MRRVRRVGQTQNGQPFGRLVRRTCVGGSFAGFALAASGAEKRPWDRSASSCKHIAGNPPMAYGLRDRGTITRREVTDPGAHRLVVDLREILEASTGLISGLLFPDRSPRAGVGDSAWAPLQVALFVAMACRHAPKPLYRTTGFSATGAGWYCAERKQPNCGFQHRSILVLKQTGVVSYSLPRWSPLTPR